MEEFHVGGRWGQDHGILIATELYDGIEWAQGGGQIWLGPDAVGGGIKLSRLNAYRMKAMQLD